MNKLDYGIGISLGMEAAKRGAKRIPANDPRFRSYIRENCKEIGSSIPVSMGWIAGYESQVTLEAQKYLVKTEIP